MIWFLVWNPNLISLPTNIWFLFCFTDHGRHTVTSFRKCRNTFKWRNVMRWPVNSWPLAFFLFSQCAMDTAFLVLLLCLFVLWLLLLLVTVIYYPCLKVYVAQIHARFFEFFAGLTTSGLKSRTLTKWASFTSSRMLCLLLQNPQFFASPPSLGSK